ncbi:MAG: Cysteine desulfuration protein SufE [Alphaproteobacteria bacterium MarineAlpha5_Bin10]|nr:MAG: Cysteine desulfuration protein SufE [Alphaproteobacteria bacterium MarineAlpha5_Bin10]|tara:strand:- start:13497 stop:13913 length:417 start_codon:yes stop_codon:yes gene_type:complete
MDIEEKILNYKKELDFFDEPIDKYKYLLDQGRKSRDFPEKYKQEVFLVKGCQAQVWLVPNYNKGTISFLGDSDAFITKGMISIIIDIYGDRSPKEIIESDFGKLNMLGLDNILTPSRRNGVYSMLEYVKNYAKGYLEV